MNGIIRNSEIVALLAITAVLEFLFPTPSALYLDLPLFFALYIGWYSSPSKGAVCGIAFGLLQDVFSRSYLGLNGTSKTLLGFGGSYLSKWLVLESFLARCALIGSLSLLDNVIVITMEFLLGQPIQQGWLRTLIEIPVTGILGGGIFQIYDRVKFPQKDFRRL